MDRGKDQVPGLSRGQGHGDRVQVPHLADDDDIRVLPERMLEPEAKEKVSVPTSRWTIRLFLRLMDILDRVLNGDDLGLFILVDVIDHMDHGRGLAHTRAADDRGSGPSDGARSPARPEEGRAR